MADATPQPVDNGSAARVSPPALWPRLLAAALLALAGGSAAFFRTQPLYRSEAVVLIHQPPQLGEFESVSRPVTPDVLAEVAAIATSDRTLNVAIFNPAYAALGRPVSPRALAEFETHASVHAGPGSLLHLAFTDPDPRAAQAGAQALGQALRDTYTLDEGRDATKRIDILTGQEAALGNDLRTVSAELEHIVKEYGTLDLDYVWRARFAELSATERETERLTLSGDSTTRPATVAQLKERQERLAAAMKRLGEASQEVRGMRDRVGALQREIDPLHEQIRTMSLSQLVDGRLKILDDGKLPLTPAIDERVRNATLGGVAGLVVFFVLRGLVRIWRWRRAMGGKTGFPIFKPEPPAPRPAIALDAAEAGGA